MVWSDPWLRGSLSPRCIRAASGLTSGNPNPNPHILHLACFPESVPCFLGTASGTGP